MSAAAKASQVAQHALRSSIRAAKDVAKNTLPKDASRSRSTPSTAEGPAYDSPVSKDGLRSPDTKATSQWSPSRDASREPSPSIEKPTRTSPSPLLRYLYDPHPTALNYTTFAATRSIASDPSHPFHIRTLRRLNAFDPTFLHWRVQVPIDVSKKSAIRNWAKKRIMREVVRQLDEMGLERDGTVKEGGQGEGLRGALLVLVSKDARVALRFTEEEAREDVASVLAAVRARMRSGRRMGPALSPMRERIGVEQV